MRETRVSLPLIASIAATRGLLGVGIGMLIAGRLSARRRGLIGRILFGAGVLSTIPIAIEVFRRRRAEQELPSFEDLEDLDVEAFEVLGETGADIDTVAVFLEPEGP